MPTASVTPVELAAKSNHSPLRVVVQYACSNSNRPLIRMGASHAHQNSLPLSNVVCWRRYSIQMTEQVPPYITRWVHLSMNWTSSNGVSGKKGVSESIHISAIQNTEQGYFLTN